jgi:hypothetical protein
MMARKKRVLEQERQDILRQCPRCLGRMTGPLAGVVANRLLEDYTHDALCTACQAELADLAQDAPAAAPARKVARKGKRKRTTPKRERKTR